MKLLILHKYLITGGIERTLLSYFPIFDELGYKADLLLTYNVDFQENSLQKLLPVTQSVSYIFSEKQSKDLLDLQQKKHNSLFHKVYYELSRSITRYKISKAIHQKTKQNQYDLILDFSGILDKYSFKQHLKAPIIRWLQSENDLQQLIRKPKRFQDYQRIVAITQAMQTRLLKETSLENNKFYMMYQPLNLLEIQQKSRQKANIEHQDYFLVVSRLVNGKGLIELIDIYAQLKETGVKNKLYIIGEGELESELHERIRILSLENDCFILGAKSNPYPYFKAAKLFTFTSESEGFGMVILESMACGTPVVVMDCPIGPQEIIGKNNEYGKLIPLHNKAQFIEATLELLNNQDIYNDYKEKGLNRSLDFSQEKAKYHIQDLFNTTLEIYKWNSKA